MTNMKRVTIALPKDIDHKILGLRKTDRFVRCSYSEIIRQLIVIGIETNSSQAISHDQQAE